MISRIPGDDLRRVVFLFYLDGDRFRRRAAILVLCDKTDLMRSDLSGGRRPDKDMTVDAVVCRANGQVFGMKANRSAFGIAGGYGKDQRLTDKEGRITGCLGANKLQASSWGITEISWVPISLANRIISILLYPNNGLKMGSEDTLSNTEILPIVWLDTCPKASPVKRAPAFTRYANNWAHCSMALRNKRVR